MRIVPIVFNWMEVEVINPDSGEARRTWAMVPQRRFDNVAKSQYDPAHEYPMVVQEVRSQASHRHYFAAIKDAFDNLPHNLEVRFANAEHLRKWCLIEAGWCDERDYEFANPTSAKRFAVFFREEVDAYARFILRRNLLLVRRAKSQDHHSMDKDTFERSKRDVLDMCSSLVGIKPADLKKNAGKAA